MKKWSFLLIALFTSTAFADALNYNYVQLGYAKTDIDIDGTSESFSGDGWLISGSAAINENFHVFGGYNKTGFDFGIDETDYGLGLGYSKAISDKTDFVATASFLKAKLDSGDFQMGSVSDNGYGVSVGVRSMVSDKVELAGAIEYVDIADSGDTGLTAGALYNITDTVALGVQGAWSDGASSYGLGFRMYFGD